jgi:hypothetical protein
MNKNYKTWEYLQKCDGGLAKPNNKSKYLNNSDIEKSVRE